MNLSAHHTQHANFVVLFAKCSFFIGWLMSEVNCFKSFSCMRLCMCFRLCGVQAAVSTLDFNRALHNFSDFLIFDSSLFF